MKLLINILIYTTLKIFLYYQANLVSINGNLSHPYIYFDIGNLQNFRKIFFILNNIFFENYEVLIPISFLDYFFIDFFLIILIVSNSFNLE